MKRTILPLTAAALVANLWTGAWAATPAAGVPQAVRTGFFADVNMGGFFTLGGKSLVTGGSRPSNAQAYLQLGVGYDVHENFALGLSFALGASAASCYSVVDGNGACVRSDTDRSVVADNFTVTMFAGEVSYKHHFNSRLSLQPRLHIGWAALDPEPMFDGDKAVTGGVLVGAAVGAEYATHMEHFSIGADLDWRMVVGPNMQAFAFYPKIKYTF